MTQSESQSRRFDDMKTQIDRIVEAQEFLGRDVSKVRALLEGDDFANGMVFAVKDHERRLKKLETAKDRATWIFLGMAGTSSYGIIEIIRKIFISFVVLALFTSCVTPKRQGDIAYRHFRENPAELAKLASIHFPIQPKIGKLSFDTLRTVIRDTIACPDGTFAPCPECLTETIIGLRVDTVPDVARIQALESENTQLVVAELVLKAQLEQALLKSKRRFYAAIVLTLLLLVCIYLLFKP